MGAEASQLRADRALPAAAPHVHGPLAARPATLERRHDYTRDIPAARCEKRGRAGRRAPVTFSCQPSLRVPAAGNGALTFIR